MCTKPFSQTKNKGKLFLVAKSSGPLLARMPLKPLNSPLALAFSVFCNTVINVNLFYKIALPVYLRNILSKVDLELNSQA